MVFLERFQKCKTQDATSEKTSEWKILAFELKSNNWARNLLFLEDFSFINNTWFKGFSGLLEVPTEADVRRCSTK